MTERTLAMRQKMEAFTDAGLYEQDKYIDFLPEGHVYLYRGETQLLPVSTLVGYFSNPSTDNVRPCAIRNATAFRQKRHSASGTVLVVWPAR